MRTELILVHNIRALLDQRKDSQRDLAMWMGHHESWLSKILKAERRLGLDEIDRMADYFGLQGYQLLAPGIGPLTERRRGDRRSGRERRSGGDRRGDRRNANEPDRRTGSGDGHVKRFDASR